MRTRAPARVEILLNLQGKVSLKPRATFLAHSNFSSPGPDGHFPGFSYLLNNTCVRLLLSLFLFKFLVLASSGSPDSAMCLNFYSKIIRPNVTNVTNMANMATKMCPPDTEYTNIQDTFQVRRYGRREMPETWLPRQPEGIILARIDSRHSLDTFQTFNDLSWSIKTGGF